MSDGTVIHGRTMLRGLRLLELIAVDGPTTISALAQSSGIDKGTASRLLISLRETGYVQQDAESKQYRLGSKAVWLWQRFSDQFPLAPRLRGVVRRLAEETGESVTVGIPVQDELECLVTADSSQPLRVTRQRGERFSLTGSDASIGVVSAPIVEPAGIAVASLSIWMPLSRLVGREAELERLAAAAAAEIAALLPT